MRALCDTWTHSPQEWQISAEYQQTHRAHAWLEKWLQVLPLLHYRQASTSHTQIIFCRPQHCKLSDMHACIQCALQRKPEPCCSLACSTVLGRTPECLQRYICPSTSPSCTQAGYTGSALMRFTTSCSVTAPSASRLTPCGSGSTAPGWLDMMTASSLILVMCSNACKGPPITSDILPAQILTDCISCPPWQAVLELLSVVRHPDTQACAAVIWQHHIMPLCTMLLATPHCPSVQDNADIGRRAALWQGPACRRQHAPPTAYLEADMWLTSASGSAGGSSAAAADAEVSLRQLTFTIVPGWTPYLKMHPHESRLHSRALTDLSFGCLKLQS